MNVDVASRKGIGFGPRELALMAGFGLLLMVVFVGLAEGVGLANMIVDGDAAASSANILANEGRFRFAIFAHLMVIILDIVVAWALYLFLKREAPGLALLAGWLRLTYAIFYGVALLNLLAVFQYLAGADFLAVFSTAQLQAQAMLALDAFRDGWNVGFIFFGLHLLVLGWAALRAGFIPKWISALLLLGGLAYLVDYVVLLFRGDFLVELSLIFGWGELLFMFWLLFRGGKADR